MADKTSWTKPPSPHRSGDSRGDARRAEAAFDARGRPSPDDGGTRSSDSGAAAGADEPDARPSSAWRADGEPSVPVRERRGMGAEGAATVSSTPHASNAAAQPRAAPAPPWRRASRVARLVGCSGLVVDRGRRPAGFCPAAFAFAKETNNRSVLFTAAESRKTAAISGSRRTTFVPRR